MPKKRSKKPQTVEERRKEVLATGRKFKYPLQFAKYKVVFYTIIIAFIALIALFLFSWLAFYQWNTTSDVAYRVSKVLPLPVAEIDGEKVKYSDYLMIYRSSLSTIEQQSGQMFTAVETNSIEKDYRRAALDDAEEYAYARKIAREQGIEVIEDEINKSYDEHRKVGGIERSEESFLNIIDDNFGLDRDEYRYLLGQNLLKSKVMLAVDETAKQTTSDIERLLTERDGDFKSIAETLGDKVQYEETGGLVDETNLDGGRATTASTLEPGAISARFLSTSGDGYYYVKLIDKTETEVNYVSIKIPFTEFDNRIASLKSSDKIQEYIHFE